MANQTGMGCTIKSERSELCPEKEHPTAECGKLGDPPEESPWTDRPGLQRIAVSKARYADNLRIWVSIGDAPARALIDSGCTGNFISL
jgi:hypothetical protein